MYFSYFLIHREERNLILWIFVLRLATFIVLPNNLINTFINL